MGSQVNNEEPDEIPYKGPALFAKTKSIIRERNTFFFFFFFFFFLGGGGVISSDSLLLIMDHPDLHGSKNGKTF